MNRNLLKQSAVFCALVGLAVTVRLMNPTPNFAAVGAAALFAGFYFQSRMTAMLVPLVIMTISDQFLGGYSKPIMLAVYGSLLIPIAWRSLLRTKLSPLRVGGAALSSTLAFYLITNAAVWYTWYPRNWDGVIRCYYAALPFLANSVTSDLFFAAGFFGLYAVAVRFSHATSKLAASAA